MIEVAVAKSSVVMPKGAHVKGAVAEIRALPFRSAGWLAVKHAVGCHFLWSAIHSESVFGSAVRFRTAFFYF